MILEERGFSSMDELQQSLWEMLKGSCYYLEQPDCNPSTVRDKLQFHRRKENLFSRHRSVFIYDDGDRYRAFATMSDGWHELQVDITARKNDYEVTDAHGVFVRGPDELCLKSADMLVGIIGQRFSPENIRELTKAGGNGCEHLMDLTREAIRSVHSDWVQRREGMRCPIRGAGGEIALQR
jgi:hypothetical protein